MGEEAYLIENLDECKGLLLSHPHKRIIFKFKHVTELLYMFLGVHIEFGEFFEYGDIWGSLLQEVDECGCRGSFLHFVSQRRSYNLPKLVRKPKFLPISRSWGLLAIYDPFHYDYQGLILWERHLSSEHLNVREGISKP